MSEKVVVYWHGRNENGTPYVSASEDPTIYGRTFIPYVSDEEGPWVEVAKGGGLLPGLWDYWRANRIMAKRNEHEMDALEVGDHGVESETIKNRITAALNDIQPDNGESKPLER